MIRCPHIRIRCPEDGPCPLWTSWLSDPVALTAMQVALHNNVKVYNLTAGKSLPEWLAQRKKNKSTDGDRRVELIQDLEFPHFTRMMFRTPDGSYLFAAGEYPPRLKCFDVNDLSLKYSFNADMPIVSGVSLSPDFRKFALRGEGRMITVHHSANVIDRLRVPHAQRCLEYHEHSAELMSGGASHEVFRINLDTGCFVESFKTASEDGVNTVDYWRGHGLTLLGGENGVVEAWDPRQGTAPAASLAIAGSAKTGVAAGASISAVATDRGGLVFGAGTSTGEVALFDVRLNKPLLVKDHMTSLPIVKIHFFEGRAGETTHVCSADTQALKVWGKTDGANFTTLEAPAQIYDFTVVKSQHNLAAPYECADSGVFCLCCDTPKVQVHFVPQLGVAPKWSSFLDSITEELEERDAAVVYDDYQFIPKAELDQLGVSPESITDGRVRPLMNGAYIENRLYRELKAVADPQAFGRHAMAQQRAKRDRKVSERISKFKRTDPEAEAAAVPAGSSAAPFLKGMSPAAMELIGRDPRFAAKMGTGEFAVDKRNPESLKLFQKVEQERAKAAERRRKYEDSQYRVVPDDEAAAGAAPEAPEADEPRRKAPRGDGLVMMEADSTAALATDDQTHAMRKADRRKGLSLAKQLVKMKKK